MELYITKSSKHTGTKHLLPAAQEPADPSENKIPHVKIIKEREG